MNKKKKHDNFFRTVFSKPKNARKLLTLAAKKNIRLRQLLTLIDLDSLRQIPGDASREGLSGNADVAFHVNLLNRKEDLFVGLVLEHKSFYDSGLRMQLLKYYMEVIEQKSPGKPMVAIVVYNGKNTWSSLPKPFPKYPEYFQDVGLPFKVELIDIGDQISLEEFDKLDPTFKLAMVAMLYVFDSLGMKEKFTNIMVEFVRSPNEESRKVVEEVIVYLKDSLGDSEKEVLMDTLEALRNKGFVSIADAEQMEIEALRKEKAALQKETETLQKETATLQKEAETLQKENETLQKQTDSLAKEKDEQARVYEAKIAALEAALAART